MDNETAVQSWILWSSDFHYENLNYEVFYLVTLVIYLLLGNFSVLKIPSP